MKTVRTTAVLLLALIMSASLIGCQGASESATEENAIDFLTGTYYEVEVLDSRTLTVNSDGTYKLEYRGGGFIDGTVELIYEEYPDGTKGAWFMFYESDGAEWAGFPKDDGDYQKELLSGQDGEMHFVNSLYIDEYDRMMSNLDEIPPEEMSDASSGWKKAYLEVVERWNKDHGSDTEVRYNLAYIDDNDIPELILFGDEDAWYAVDMYTFEEGSAQHMTVNRKDKSEESDSPYTSPGHQGKGDYYLEKQGFVLLDSGMMGSLQTVGCKMEGADLQECFKYDYIDVSFDKNNKDPYSYELFYVDNDGKEVKLSKVINEEDGIYEISSIPEAKDLEKVFGISFSNLKDLTDNTMSYEDIMTAVNN